MNWPKAVYGFFEAMTIIVFILAITWLMGSCMNGGPWWPGD